MLINDIITEEIVLKEFGGMPKYNPDLVKGITYNTVKYTWNKADQSFSNEKTGEVVKTGKLFKALIVAQPLATGKPRGGVTKRALSKVGKAIGATGVAQQSINDPKSGIFKRSLARAGAYIGRGVDKVIPGPGGKKQAGAPTVGVQGTPKKGDVRPLVDTKGKPLVADHRGDGSSSTHEFEFAGNLWMSQITGKVANTSQAQNLNGQYVRQGSKNDTSDDEQNLQRQVEQGNLSQKDADQIRRIYQSGKADSLNSAYQLWQGKKNPSTPSTPKPKSPSPILDPSGQPFNS